MRYSKNLKLLWGCVTLALLSYIDNAKASSLVSKKSCWSSQDDNNCQLQMKFHSLDASMDSEILLDIVCSIERNWNETIVESFRLLDERFLPVVILNGCRVPLLYDATHISSYGLTLIPQAENIIELTIERFHDEALQELKTANGQNLSVQLLRLRHNDIASVGSEAFDNAPQLRELHFESNSLRHLASGFCDNLTELQTLFISQETRLAIKEMQNDLLLNCKISNLFLLDLKRLSAKIFENLPLGLTKLSVARTELDSSTLLLTNPQQLREVEFSACYVQAFEFVDDFVSLQKLNLSGNALVDFRIKSPEGSVLSQLDLSNNELLHLQPMWFKGLQQLQELYLHGNHFKTLSYGQLLMLPCSFIDLSNNELLALKDVNLPASRRHHEAQVTLQIDRNPWNCMWLLDFAQSYPEKFRIFQYQKYISQINVNGLECNADLANKEERAKQQLRLMQAIPELQDSSTTATISTTNAPTIVNATLYASQGWDFKRSQRDEALIIVFMLPLGIAFLFLLLYMWIYCQKLFHWSYYCRLPLIGNRRNATRGLSADRVDVVRHMPPTQQNGSVNPLADGYEIPLNGVTTICNCHHHHHASGLEGNTTNNNVSPSAMKCRKKLHVTYEPIPSERPYKIYEEILGEEGKVVMEDGQTVHPFYDHLTYVQKLDANTKF